MIFRAWVTLKLAIAGLVCYGIATIFLVQAFLDWNQSGLFWLPFYLYLIGTIPFVALKFLYDRWNRIDLQEDRERREVDEGNKLLAQMRDRPLREPLDLPGRFGIVVQNIDEILDEMACPAVLTDGWAVWRYGGQRFLPLEIRIIVPSSQAEAFLEAAGGSELETGTEPHDCPHVRHLDTNTDVYVNAEGSVLQSSTLPATTVKHPTELGADANRLSFISLPALIEHKLAQGSERDERDVADMLGANPGEVEAIKQHLQAIHPSYVDAFVRIQQESA